LSAPSALQDEVMGAFEKVSAEFWPGTPKPGRLESRLAQTSRTIRRAHASTVLELQSSDPAASRTQSNFLEGRSDHLREYRGRIINIAPQYHYAIWPQYGFLSAIEDLEKLIFDGVKGIRFHGPP